MNLLAHAYLSFNQPSLLTGNMISDYVKGKNKLQYPEDIQRGITLHRAIDEFTDRHAATQEAKKFFSVPYRLYAGAFIDIVYDHFLANDRNEFENDLALDSFARTTYTSLFQNEIYLPQKFRLMLPHMQAQNWLYHYKEMYGIKKSFAGLVHRAAYLHESDIAFAIFEKEHAALQKCYNAFFPALKNFTLHWMQVN